VRSTEIDFEHLFGRPESGLSAYIKDMSHLRPRFENLFNRSSFSGVRVRRVQIAPARARARGIEIDLSSDQRRALGLAASYAYASALDEWTARGCRAAGTSATLSTSASTTGVAIDGGQLAGIYHTAGRRPKSRGAGRNPDGSLGIRPILGPRNALR